MEYKHIKPEQQGDRYMNWCKEHHSSIQTSFYAYMPDYDIK